MVKRGFLVIALYFLLELSILDWQQYLFHSGLQKGVSTQLQTGSILEFFRWCRLWHFGNISFTAFIPDMKKDFLVKALSLRG